MGKLISKNPSHGNDKIGKTSNCPICGLTFHKSTSYYVVNSHIDYCSLQTENLESQFENDNPLKKMKTFSFHKKLDIDSIVDLPFEHKFKIFREKVECLKNDWRNGSELLKIRRESTFEDSMANLYELDLYKELKINFEGEISSDAGGLIREWFTVIFEDIENESRGLFQRSDTENFSYIISPNLENNSRNLEIFEFIGVLIAKALLENLTINTCFNSLIYKMIFNEEIDLDHIEKYDKPLFLSLKELKNNQKISDLEIYFSINYIEEGNILEEDLITNGSSIRVNNKNINLYIKKRIDHIKKLIMPFINKIKEGLFSLIPQPVISIFSSKEFELVLNGESVINVKDWKTNTIYQGAYNEKSKTIQLFWKLIGEMPQRQLKKFLQFSTGSSRVPIGGFKKLESNRGQISKFCIVPVEINKNGVNYIRAHTCFNRIDLPKFETQHEMMTAFNFIVNNAILGFGIE